jgi:cobalt-zinc-cadmium efflux system outer membrane protein
MSPFSLTLRLFLGLVLLAPVPRAEPAPDTVALPDLVATIVAGHPELGFYEAEIAAARAGLRTAGARANPELSLDLGRRRVTDSAGVLAGEGTAWGVSLSQTFEWPGRLALRKAVANRDVELAELGLTRFRSALAARAQLLAFGLHAAAEKSAAVREVADRFADLKDTYLARDPAGLTPLLETRVIEAQELALQRRATEAGLAAAAALVELNQLRGEPPTAILRLAPVSPRFQSPPGTDALLAAARESNFDFRTRKLELEQQGFAVRLAQHERHPSFSVSPYYSQARAGDREQNYGIGLSLPLPLSSANRAGSDAAVARQRQAEVALLVAQRELERAVITTAQAFAAKVAESQRWAPESVEKFREAAALADRHYRLGAVPVGTYVELQTSYLDAVEALLDTRTEALEAGLTLQQLTGLELNRIGILP